MHEEQRVTVIPIQTNMQVYVTYTHT